MKVECPHCHAKVGRARLDCITLACYPPIHQTFCPVCNKLIEEEREGGEDYEVDLSNCTAKAATDGGWASAPWDIPKSS